jgi:hypothetical protein
MNILHELKQLDYGGVERVIRNIVKFDKENTHTILSYKEGPFRAELEKVGAKVMIVPQGGEASLSFDADILHVHTGGAISEMATGAEGAFPVVETIHSPVRSPMRSSLISQRVGVTNTVSKLNDNCITIYNGDDLEDILPTRGKEEVKKELGIPEGIPVIGRLGRVSTDKGLEEWLLTCYTLQCQGLQFVPLIVGDEPDYVKGYIGKLKLMATSLPVKGIVWAGHHADMGNYMQVMDVFLYPSPTEGFGLVFIEAMYNDAVVVAYDNDVAKEVMAGYAVLTGNKIEDLANGVKKALNPMIREAITSLAAGWVETEFDAKDMSRKYQELYKNVLEKRKK